MIQIREERPDDAAAIREVNDRAFGQDQEGRIVDALRANGAATLSLVATLDDRIVGHIMYSPVIVGDVTGAGLGPMAVLPEHQNQGIGSALVRSGSEKIAQTACPFIVVLGHASFYPRFDFRPASTHGITCEWGVPDDVFMLLALDDHAMQGTAGVARYRTEFHMDVHELHARHTIELARRARAAGNHPFGALLAIGDRVLLAAQNSVMTDRDPTAHAETNLVAEAIRTLSREEIRRSTLYTSCEPCVMCVGKMYWAGIRSLVFALPSSELALLAGPDFLVPCAELFARAAERVTIIGPLLVDEARDVHRGYWPPPHTPR
jgi:putative acetyltransferase